MALALAAAIGVPAGAEATPDPTARFSPVPEGAVVNHLPKGLSEAAVTLMLEVSGAPVTVANAEAVTPRSDAQQRQHERDLEQRQAPIERQVRELGGTVLGTYQSAYNGVKVRIPADKAAALARHPRRRRRPTRSRR